MWLSQLHKNGGLTSEDLLNIKIDTDTFKYLNTSFVVNGLIKKLGCPVKFFISTPPETLELGMMLKYAMINYSQSKYMYCDIDILILMPLHLITDAVEFNTICLHNEGTFNDSNYSSAFSEEELTLLSKTTPGFSAGKFIIHGRELHAKFTNIVFNLFSMRKKTHFTFEQPFFNRAIYCLDLNTEHINTNIMSGNIVSSNGHNMLKTHTVLLDCMGMPGDAKFHFDKIFDLYISLHNEII